MSSSIARSSSDEKSALRSLAVRERWLDDLGDVGTAIRTWRAEIIEDLGGEESVSAMQRVLIDSASKTYILLCSVDAWLLRQNPINKRTKSLYPIVAKRQQLADALARYMEKLGLERRQKPVPSLQQYLETRKQDPSNDD